MQALFLEVFSKQINGGSNWTRVQEFDNTMVNSAGGVGSLGISSIAFSA